jgi:hypothetical protein
MQQQAFALYQCRVSPAATRDYLYSYDPTKPDIPVNQPLSHAEVQEFQRLRETFLQQGGTLPSHDFHDWVMPEQCAPELIEQLVNYSVRTDYHQRPFSYPLTLWDCCILRYLVHHFIRTKLFQLTTNEDDKWLRKIDRSFISELGESGDCLGRSSILDRASAFPRWRKASRRKNSSNGLRQTACTEIQGYLFSRPIPRAKSWVC